MIRCNASESLFIYFFFNFEVMANKNYHGACIVAFSTYHTQISNNIFCQTSDLGLRLEVAFVSPLSQQEQEPSPYGVDTVD